MHADGGGMFFALTAPVEVHEQQMIGQFDFSQKRNDLVFFDGHGLLQRISTQTLVLTVDLSDDTTRASTPF